MHTLLHEYSGGRKMNKQACDSCFVQIIMNSLYTSTFLLKQGHDFNQKRPTESLLTNSRAVISEVTVIFFRLG